MSDCSGVFILTEQMERMRSIDLSADPSSKITRLFRSNRGAIDVFKGGTHVSAQNGIHTGV